MVAAVIIPSNSQGLTIPVSSGGYNMTGLTAVLLLKSGEFISGPPAATLSLVVQGGGLTATYTTVGGEFAGLSGPFDVQLKVSNNVGLLLYSLFSAEGVYIQPTLG